MAVRSLLQNAFEHVTVRTLVVSGCAIIEFGYESVFWPDFWGEEVYVCMWGGGEGEERKRTAVWKLKEGCLEVSKVFVYMSTEKVINHGVYI